MSSTSVEVAEPNSEKPRRLVLDTSIADAHVLRDALWGYKGADLERARTLYEVVSAGIKAFKEKTAAVERARAVA